MASFQFLNFIVHIHRANLMYVYKKLLEDMEPTY